MPLKDHPGLSEADVEAAEVLDELRFGSSKKRNFDSVNNKSEQNREPPTLLDRVVNNVVTFYDDFNSRKRVASLARLLDDAYEDNYTSSDDDDDTEDEHEDEQEHESNEEKQVSEVRTDKYKKRREMTREEKIQAQHESLLSKRKVLSEAYAKSMDNLKEYKLNMSIESKKKLITCLHLLKLANKQLADKVTYLQELVEEEHDHENTMNHHHHHKHRRPHSSSTSSRESHGSNQSEENEQEVEEEEEFFDAFDENDYDEKSTVIKMEIVGTIKKVYTMVSRFTGSSLPEPARSQVRETLLNLPTNWSSTVNSTTASIPSIESATMQKSESNDNKRLKTNDGNLSSTSKPDCINNTETPPYQSLSANGKVLILAKESLDVVQNVMDVVDSTLAKAEEYIKQRQEVKEVIYQQFLEKQEPKDLTKDKNIT